MDDTSSGLSADGRITLRTALQNPQHFAAMVLQHFYEPQLLLQLFNTKLHINDAYSYYGNHTLVYCLDGWKFGTRKRHFDGWCVVSQTNESGRELSFIE